MEFKTVHAAWHRKAFAPLALAWALGSAGALAQPAAAALPASAPALNNPAAAAATLGFASVRQALASLEARDGNGTIVTHPEGWVVINEPLASAQWSFTPVGHAAYPAVVRRVIRRGPQGATVETASLCEAPAEACAALLLEFQAMNERITQAVQSRNRQGSTPGQTPPQ